MLLPTLLTAVLASPPAVGLAVSNQLGKATSPPQAYLDDIERELVGVGVPVRRLTLDCKGEPKCLLDGAREAGVPAVVGVSFAYGKKGVTLDLEALRVEDAAVLSQLTFSTGSRLQPADREGVRRFGQPLVEALKPRAVDAPVVEPRREATLTPPEPPPPSVLVVTEPAPRPARSRAPAWVLGGGAVAAGIVAGIFLGMAVSAETTLNTTPDPSPLTRPQAQALADGANRDYSVALGAGVGAGALATAAVIWLATE